MSNRKCEFSFRPVHPNEVKDLVLSLKNTGSAGVDEINTRVLKLVIDQILPALTHVINLSLSTMTFPNLWKLAKVIPLFKKEDPLLAKNYRPVSLLPILSKILEKVVFQQVMAYLDQNELLHPSHHGSRADHSTTTALTLLAMTYLTNIKPWGGDICGLYFSN